LPINNINQIFNTFGDSVTLHEPAGWHSNTYQATVKQVGDKIVYVGPIQHDISKLSSDAWLEHKGQKYSMSDIKANRKFKEAVFISAILTRKEE
jgi:hypothetical protein